MESRAAEEHAEAIKRFSWILRLQDPGVFWSSLGGPEDVRVVLNSSSRQCKAPARTIFGLPFCD
jgi:hypothetical protein